MHVESTERGVGPLPCGALPIGINHPRNTELIFLFVPTKCHHHVWRLWTVNLRLVETERSRQRISHENNAGKIRLLQKLNEKTCDGRVVSDDINKNAATVPDQHDISRFWFVAEFGLRVPTRVF